MLCFAFIPTNWFLFFYKEKKIKLLDKKVANKRTGCANCDLGHVKLWKRQIIPNLRTKLTKIKYNLFRVAHDFKKCSFISRNLKKLIDFRPIKKHFWNKFSNFCLYFSVIFSDIFKVYYLILWARNIDLLDAIVLSYILSAP